MESVFEFGEMLCLDGLDVAEIRKVFDDFIDVSETTGRGIHGVTIATDGERKVTWRRPLSDQPAVVRVRIRDFLDCWPVVHSE